MQCPGIPAALAFPWHPLPSEVFTTLGTKTYWFLFTLQKRGIVVGEEQRRWIKCYMSPLSTRRMLRTHKLLVFSDRLHRRAWKGSAVERSAFVFPAALQYGAIPRLKWKNGESNACPFSSNSSHRAFALRRASRRRRVINKREGDERKDGLVLASRLTETRAYRCDCTLYPCIPPPQNMGKMMEIPSAFKLFDPLQRKLQLMALKKRFKSSQAWTSALHTSYRLGIRQQEVMTRL